MPHAAPRAKALCIWVGGLRYHHVSSAVGSRVLYLNSKCTTTAQLQE